MYYINRSLYFIPDLVGILIGGFVEGYAGFIAAKKTLADNTTYTCFGIMLGVYKYGFLGLAWPITFPVLIGRFIDSKK
jgi:ABC-type enterochelin transport system permease subunit